MDTSFIVIAYCVYLPITLALTWYVARVLFNNGRIFMLDIFRGRENIADATNSLFQVGFYLLNIGFALLMLKADHSVANTQGLFELLSFKIGRFSIYLGIMLFANLYLFFRGKRKSKEAQLKAEGKLPVTPTAADTERPKYI